MACLAEQLLSASRIEARVSELETERLKSILITLLAMPHAIPTVIVVDGLDEISESSANGKFALGQGWFPEALGENVHVVFGVRFGPGLADVEKLRSELHVPDIEEFLLDDLDLAAVEGLVNEPRQHFAESIYQKTQGLAIYAAAVADAVN
jgi:hypothetical protein